MGNFVDFIHKAALSGDTKMWDEFLTDISDKSSDNPVQVQQFMNDFNTKYQSLGIAIDETETRKLMEANEKFRENMGYGITPKY